MKIDRLFWVVFLLLCLHVLGIRLFPTKEEDAIQIDPVVKQRNRNWKESLIRKFESSSDHPAKKEDENVTQTKARGKVKTSKKINQPKDYKEDIPLFIIAGTQKSGSTVLAAYLAHHPNISFAKRKELHFFDKITNYEKGRSYYLSEFVTSPDTVVMGEATPYYLASRMACARIAEHFPRTKMIVILREPIARAYSEYQMKVRRVAEQNAFFALVRQHVSQVRGCLKGHPNDFPAIKKCLPVEIAEHGRYPKFTKALKKVYEKSGKNWSRAIGRCFVREKRRNLHVSASVNCNPFASNLLSDAFSSPCYQNNSSSYSAGWSSSSRSLLWTGRREKLRDEKEGKAEAKYEFDPASCWEHYKEGYESVNSVEDAFLGEIEEFKTCSKPFFPSLPSLSASSAANGDTSSVLTDIMELDQNIDDCVKVQGGISRQYFYRSLYVVQFHHCFKSIDSSQFLVIGNQELRNSMTDVVRRVCDFLGVPSLPIEKLIAEEHVGALVTSKFPNFEKTTGWKMNSTYQAIPEAVQQYLENYYSQYNELLFQYLQKNFTGLW